MVELKSFSSIKDQMLILNWVIKFVRIYLNVGKTRTTETGPAGHDTQKRRQYRGH